MTELNEKENARLDDAALEGAAGGENQLGMIRPGYTYNCTLNGAYWRNSYQSDGPYYDKQGWPMQVVYNPNYPGQAQYLLSMNGTPVGFTTWYEFYLN